MLASAAFALVAAVPAQNPPPAVDLEEVVVVAGHPTGRVFVVVDGEADARALVISEPDMRCGPETWRWDAYGRPRLCWLRRRLESSVTLRATWDGRTATGWTVDWEGCDRVAAPDRCEVTVRPDVRVRATFRQL